MEPLDTSMHPCEIFEISCLWGSHRSNFEKQTVVKMVDTVDGRNPAPPGMYKKLVNIGINYIYLHINSIMNHVHIVDV